MPPTEWQRLAALTQVERPFPRESTVVALFEATALAQPERPAVVCGDQALTYRELNQRANRLARRLIALGVGRETLVAICAERSPEL
ncbi:AMP-binding protein, partial [Methylogaea oryzae]